MFVILNLLRILNNERTLIFVSVCVCVCTNLTTGFYPLLVGCFESALGGGRERKGPE